MECWLEIFRDFTVDKGVQFPIQDPGQFNRLLDEWTTTTVDGSLSKSNYTVGFIDGKIRYF